MKERRGRNNSSAPMVWQGAVTIRFAAGILALSSPFRIRHGPRSGPHFASAVVVGDRVAYSLARLHCGTCLLYCRSRRPLLFHEKRDLVSNVRFLDPDF